MRILAIETSCDETAAAIVEDGINVISNIIASQIPLHQKTGGVVPEVAAREHVLKIVPVILEALNFKNSALAEAASFSGVDAIAVTRGPGLLSSLVIGTTAASTLATYLNKPLIPVNHIAGHIYANWLDTDKQNAPQFPIMVLTVSGGHNELVLMRSHANFELLGETLDDAAGEAFDKVARLLNLGYPGGPAIAKAATPGDPTRFPLPKAHINKDSYDFSFSGLKTAVLNLVQQEHKKRGRLTSQFTKDCAASFQEAVCQILSDKLIRAAEQHRVKEIHLAGGVSANQHLRELVRQKIDEHYYNNHLGRRITTTTHEVPISTANGVRSTCGARSSSTPRLRYPQKLSYCTDNAAMIASAAFFHYQKNSKPYLTPFPILADPGLSLYYTHGAR